MLNKKQEDNLSGFTGDIKVFIRKDDFVSALILVEDLKNFILELHKSKDTHFNRNNLDASFVHPDFTNSKDY